MRRIAFALGLILAGAGHARAFEVEEDSMFSAADPAAPVVEVLSTTDTAIFAPLIDAFLARNPDIAVHYTVTSTQELYRAIAEDHAAFDLAVSSAMDLQMKLANDGFAASYRSDITDTLPAWARWRDQLFAFSQEKVVVVVALDGMDGLPLPATRDDMIRLIRENMEQLNGRIGTYDPARSGAGYLFATQDARQSDTYWRLSEVMGSAHPKLYTASAAMLDDLQSGRLVMAYNVLGSYATARLPDWPDGKVIELRDYTDVTLRTAIVPVNADRPDLGGRFLDFLLSREGQQILEDRIGLPRIDETAFASQPHLHPIRLDPGLLVYVDPLKRSKFLSEWRAAVIQP